MILQPSFNNSLCTYVKLVTHACTKLQNYSLKMRVSNLANMRKSKSCLVASPSTSWSGCFAEENKAVPTGVKDSLRCVTRICLWPSFVRSKTQKRLQALARNSSGVGFLFLGQNLAMFFRLSVRPKGLPGSTKVRAIIFSERARERVF